MSNFSKNFQKIALNTWPIELKKKRNIVMKKTSSLSETASNTAIY